jgi:hypothetical protein
MLAAMPVAYAVDRALSRIRTHCWGFTTLEETIEHFAVLSADPACPPLADVLLDLREITSLPALEKLRELARHAGAVPGVRFRNLAIVAVRDDVAGLMRMLQIYGQRAFAATAIFDSVEAGERWLDQSLPRGPR